VPKLPPLSSDTMRQAFHVAFVVLAFYIVVAVVVVGLIIGDLPLLVASVSLLSALGLFAGLMYHRLYHNPHRE
jgi:uncharacterized membrane protein